MCCQFCILQFQRLRRIKKIPYVRIQVYLLTYQRAWMYRNIKVPESPFLERRSSPQHHDCWASSHSRLMATMVPLEWSQTYPELLSSPLCRWKQKKIQVNRCTLINRFKLWCCFFKKRSKMYKKKFEIAMFDEKVKSFYNEKTSTYHDICRSSLCMSSSNHLRYITIIW